MRNLNLKSGMKGKSMIVPLLAVALIVGGAVYVFSTGGLGGFQFAAQPSTGTPTVTGPTVQTTGGFASSFSVSGFDPLGAAATNVNVELWRTNPDGSSSQIQGETQSNAAITSIATGLANSLTGFAMVGNDNFASTTDRGTEYYYNQVPVSWTNQPGLITLERVTTYQEGTLTETGYDDGVVEATLNVTVGSGARVTTTELRIETAADTVFGNPQVANPIAVCFNETVAGTFKEIVPKSYVSTIPVPGFLAGFRYLNPCYVLPIGSLYEGVSGKESSYRFGVNIEANPGQNPVGTDISMAQFVDASYYRDDGNNWVIGFGDESSQAADADVGSLNSGASANFININFG